MPNKNQSAILGGVAIGVAIALFSIVPAIGDCLSCLAILGAGVLAVWHYTNTYQLTISGGQGAGLGAMAGVIAMLVASLIGQLFTWLGLQPGFRETLRQGLEESGLEGEQMEQFSALIESPLVIAGAIVMGLLIYAVLGAIGGAIGASTFKKGADEPPSDPFTTGGV